MDDSSRDSVSGDKISFEIVGHSCNTAEGNIYESKGRLNLVNNISRNERSSKVKFPLDSDDRLRASINDYISSKQYKVSRGVTGTGILVSGHQD